MRSRKQTGAVVIAGALLLAGAWTEGSAQAPTYSERETVFRNGSVELHGTLMLPSTDGPAPAVVFLHGSGSATREGARRYAVEFAKLGVASLFFDKRGSGASGGSWITASLSDLAGDAVAAVDRLKEEEGVDPERIGLWGVSQAGWIAPVAAARSSDVAFLMLVSGGGASPRESEMFSYRSEFRRAGLSSSEAARATEILDLYFDYLATGQDRAELLARLDEAREGRLAPLAEQLDGILPSEENRPNWSWVGAHDPAGFIERVQVPVLLLFGDLDRNHPTDLSVTRWREGLTRARNDDVTLMVFPGAGHGARMREGHSGPGRAPFADGYLEVQLGWLWLHVVNGGM